MCKFSVLFISYFNCGDEHFTEMHCGRVDVEKELERLENLDIKKVTGLTLWVSPIVVVPKSSGQVRLCVDMREANKAVKHEN